MKIERWYTAQVKTNSYKIAEQNLDRQGFNIFYPKHKITRRIGARFQEKLQPLFPGYIFVKENEISEPIVKVNSTRGVIRVVNSDGKPWQTPTSFIEDLKARCDSRQILMQISREQLCVGQKVLIKSGAFTEYVAYIEKIDEKKRIWVLLQLAENTKSVVLKDFWVN